MHFSEMDTPALLVDIDRMEANIASMADLARRNGVELRPHTKTHKCPEIARLQLESGARGITCAKLAEAEVMAAAGIDDILVANEVIGAQKYRRLLALAKRVRLCIAVDSEFGAVELNKAAEQAGARLEVLMEIDCGQNRGGVQPGDKAVELAKIVCGLDHLTLRGLMTHGGHAYGKSSRAEIEEVGLREGRVMAATAEQMRQNQISIDTVSVGSTPTAAYCAPVKGVTEIRPGAYIFGDLMLVDLFACALKNCALSVLSTVTSRPTAERAILDAGKKALTLDKGGGSCSSSYGFIPAKNTFISRLSEEHGIIESGADFEIGEKVKIIPNHACVVVNLFDEIVGVRASEVETTFKIAGRGKMT